MGGPRVALWFADAAKRMKPGDPEANEKKIVAPSGRLHAAAQKLLGKHLPKKGKECDSASNFPVHTAPGNKKESMKVRSSNIREAAKVAGGPNKFDVVLIQEGLGNFGDAFYYSREAIESAVNIFNGVKSYANHPSASEDEDRPERSVRDIFGHFENLRVQEGEGEIGEVAATLDTVPSAQWARDLMIRAIENSKKFPDTPFIGLSINANGDSEECNIDDVISKAPAGAKPKLLEAKENGIETVRVVHSFTSATSCDLVTEAGAGGKIINIIEGDE
jgi:hypothetical protein